MLRSDRKSKMQLKESSDNFWVIFFPFPWTFCAGQCPVLSRLLRAVEILGDLNAEMVTVAGSYCVCQIEMPNIIPSLC